MNVFYVLAVVLAVLVLLSLVRVGGDLEYGELGLMVRIRLGALRLTVFPVKKKKKEKPPEEKLPAATGRSESGRAWDLLQEFFPLLADAAGRFKRKIRVDQLDLDLTVAARDPATAAIAFGGANAALGMMIPLLENNFNIRERQFRSRVDFDRTSPSILVKAAFSLTVGQGVSLSLGLGFQAFSIVSKHNQNKAKKQKEAV